jgi:two-component system CitB family response regulator
VALDEQDRTLTPTGQSTATSRLDSDQLKAAARPLSAAEVAGELGMARATTQRYLTALAESGMIEMRLRSGATGRPEHEYSCTAWR